MTNATLLLTVLLVCHYLADFCLTSKAMIKAKVDGKNPLPILLHASIHALLMGFCLLVWSVLLKWILALIVLELVSHFLIDLAKARLSAQIPRLADHQQKNYWVIYGLDQLLHQLVIVVIWYYSNMN